MEDIIPLPTVEDVNIQKLKPDFKLCCKDNLTCALCLVIDIELHIPLDNDTENGGQSGMDEEDYNEETRNDMGRPIFNQIMKSFIYLSTTRVWTGI